MEFFKNHYNLFAVEFFILAIVVADIFSTCNYNWTRNTISDLGSQGYPYRLIMQIGFLTFGFTLAFGIISSGLTWPKFPILIYAIGVALTGIFSTRPFFASDHYSLSESNIHSFLAQVAGVAFTVGILFQLYFSPSQKEKWINLIFLILVLGFSISFGLFKNHQGLAQRLLYFTSFIWLVKLFKP